MIEVIITDDASVPSSIVLLDLAQTHSGKTPTDSNIERGSDVTDHIKVDLRPFTATCFVGNSMLEAAASDMDGATDATIAVDAGSQAFTVNGISAPTDRVRLVYRRLMDILEAGKLVTIVTDPTVRIDGADRPLVPGREQGRNLIRALGTSGADRRDAKRGGAGARPGSWTPNAQRRCDAHRGRASHAGVASGRSNPPETVPTRRGARGSLGFVREELMATVEVRIPDAARTAGSAVFKAALDGVTFTFRLQWNQRASTWSISLADADDVAIASGIALVPAWDLLGLVTDTRRPLGSLMLWRSMVRSTTHR